MTPGVVISEELFGMLGLGYADRGPVRLGTASKGCEVWTLGWTTTFSLEIDGITPQFCCQAVVADGLAEDVNLGSLFLQQVSTLCVEVQLHFYPDKVHLQVGNETILLKGKRNTRRIEWVQAWHEKDLIRWPRRNIELEVIEEEGEDLTQGVLDLVAVHEPP